MGWLVSSEPWKVGSGCVLAPPPLHDESVGGGTRRVSLGEVVENREKRGEGRDEERDDGLGVGEPVEREELPHVLYVLLGGEFRLASDAVACARLGTKSACRLSSSSSRASGDDRGGARGRERARGAFLSLYLSARERERERKQGSSVQF